MKRDLAALLGHLQLQFNEDAWDRLHRLREWLGTEATTAGGVGPHEAHRLTQRHVGDSLAYAATFPAAPTGVVDVGTGAGLPGLPLAIAYPDLPFLLVDVSLRRVELVKRAVRILGLANVEVQQSDARRLGSGHDMVVTRAVFAQREWATRIFPLLAEGGRAAVSLGESVPRVPPRVEGAMCEFLRLPRQVLDHSVTFLMMTRAARE